MKSSLLGAISMEVIEENLATGTGNVGKHLEEAIPAVTGDCCEINT